MSNFTFFTTLLLLAVSFGAFEAKTLPVENEWLKGSSDIFYLKGWFAANWNDAQDWCISMGGILAEPRSSEETSEINEFIGDEQICWWIGLHEEQLDVWKWQSDDSAVEYSHWHSGEPNGDGDGDGPCVSIDPYVGKTWTDFRCDRTADDAHNYLFFPLCQKKV